MNKPGHFSLNTEFKVVKRQTHQLKIGIERLNNILAGRKKVEIRFNDRDYQAGDLLQFKPDNSELICPYDYEITHVHSGLGMQEGYVALSIECITVNIHE